MSRFGHPDPRAVAPMTGPPPSRVGRIFGGSGRVLAATIAALSCAGCSFSMPIASFTGDDKPTGSIDKPAAALSRGLDGEDWRRAKAALAVALDPQGNGAGVGWSNPETGAKGSFAAVGPPYLKEDRVCRAFAARVAPRQASERRISGSACRAPDGVWTLREATENGVS